MSDREASKRLERQFRRFVIVSSLITEDVLVSGPLFPARITIAAGAGAGRAASESIKFSVWVRDAVAVIVNRCGCRKVLPTNELDNMRHENIRPINRAAID